MYQEIYYFKFINRITKEGSELHMEHLIALLFHSTLRGRGLSEKQASHQTSAPQHGR
jgi:hypothetical protein